MAPGEPRQPLTPDQRRMRMVTVVIAVVIAVLALAVGGLAVSIGAPLWIAAIVAVIVAAAVGLFMFFNMM